MFPLSSGWSSFPTHHSVDRFSYTSFFNMVQVKLSVILILAAAAIAPAFAHPGSGIRPNLKLQRLLPPGTMFDNLSAGIQKEVIQIQQDLQIENQGLEDLLKRNSRLPNPRLKHVLESNKIKNIQDAKQKIKDIIFPSNKIGGVQAGKEKEQGGEGGGGVRESEKNPWEKYRNRWETLSSSSNLRFAMIPWPVTSPPRGPGDLTEKAIKEFLSSEMLPPDAPLKKRIQSLLLWLHPDKFEQKFMGRVDVMDKAEVKAAVTSVTQCLNKLLSNVK